jgi:hypothetical protein
VLADRLAVPGPVCRATADTTRDLPIVLLRSIPCQAVKLKSDVMQGAVEVLDDF